MSEDKVSAAAEPSDGKSSIRSVRRCFEIFEMFDVRRVPMSATDIARAVGAPLSSTLDLLHSISALGYVTYDSRARTYFPSLRIALLSTWIQMSLLGDETLQAMLREIADVTRETVTISAINDLDMQYLWVVRGPRAIAFSIEEGQTVPTFDTAVGKALMARWTDAEIRTFAKRCNRRRPRGGAIDVDAVLGQVATVRERGYASAYETALESVGAVAISIGLAHERNLVIGVGGPSERIRENEAKIARDMRRVIAAYHH